MKDGGDKRERQAGTLAKNSGKSSKQDARQNRLKLALRENLKRRKSQARGRSDQASEPSNVEDVTPCDAGGKASE
jgi:hypothetical protein